jgi:hypothetical protein
MEVIIGNNTVETIQDFNKVCNFITTCKLLTPAKGGSSGFGTTTTEPMPSPTVKKWTQGPLRLMAGPLNCISFEREICSLSVSCPP